MALIEFILSSVMINQHFNNQNKLQLSQKFDTKIVPYKFMYVKRIIGKLFNKAI